ncbi:MAG: diguanylate cyclase [Fuerstiella sp.]|nr:diguanylate cyclase [Fuerstiella sp.]MCP4859154.1 diguanylate cyclase [Fuerstiella sp.]
MPQAIVGQQTSTMYCPLTPAVPTDTCAVLNRLLALCEHARCELASSSNRPPIPRGLITMLLRAMKVRDPSIILHGRRISVIARGLSELMGWEDAQRAELELAALVHDIGKIGVPEHILKKPGKLSSEEYDFVTLYHHAAICMLQALHVDHSLVSMLTLLHNNFDGAGVETKGSGASQELPLGPRILAVADAYDSLSSPKSYRRGMTHEEVIGILNEQSGSRYDGNVVRTLNRWYQSDGDALFSLGDEFGKLEEPIRLEDDERTEIVVLTQILNVLYQFQTLYDGYFLLDASGNYCIWSKGMEELSGKSLSDVAGRAWLPSDIRLAPIAQTTDQHREPAEEIVRQVLQNGRPQFTSRVCDVSESTQISVDVYTLPITNGPNKITGLVQLFRCKGGVRRETREYVELKLAATRDALTGVANRGQLETQLRHLLDDFHNHEGTRPLSMIFLDVDKFKNVNDTHGHKAGDQVLVDLTRLLQHETYSGEIIARYGGEEFVVLCPDTDLKAGIRRSERLRDAIAKSSIGGISGLNITSSFGVAVARLGDSVQTLLERADSCLYRAKETGRNRTCWEDQEKDEQAELEQEVLNEEVESKVTCTDDVWQFNDEIGMSTSLELTAMKLNAFIASCDVSVTNQEHGHLTMQMGSVGFTRRWGGTPEKQAVEIDVRFETTRETDAKTGESKTKRHIDVIIVPIGRARSESVFELRCEQIMRQLRSYLLGD